MRVDDLAADLTTDPTAAAPVPTAAPVWNARTRDSGQRVVERSCEPMTSSSLSFSRASVPGLG